MSEINETTTNLTDDTNTSTDNDYIPTDEEMAEEIVSGEGYKAFLSTMQLMSETIKFAQDLWRSEKEEFKLTPEIMTNVLKFNDEHAKPKPEDFVENDDNKWDNFNGIDEMTHDDIINIFGEGSPIIHGEHDITIDRIKEVTSTYSDMIDIMKEYHKTNVYFLHLQEMEEEKKITELIQKANESDNEEQRNNALDAVRKYNYQKNLEFLIDTDVINDTLMNRFVKAMNDKKKIEYWMKRAFEKIQRFGLSESMIFELNNFESSILGPEYKDDDNTLLFFLINLLAYSNPDDDKDNNSYYVKSILLGIDGILRKTLIEERREVIINNIKQFEEIVKMYKK